MAYDVRNIDNELASCDLSFREQCKIVYEGMKRGVKLDGCTGAPDFNFAICCAEHDTHYQGKADVPISRWEADNRLRKCILKKGIPQKLWFIPYNSNWFLAGVYYGVVTLFGGLFHKGNRNVEKQIAVANVDRDIAGP